MKVSGTVSAPSKVVSVRKRRGPNRAKNPSAGLPCACGCGVKLKGKQRRFASGPCNSRMKRLKKRDVNRYNTLIAKHDRLKLEHAGRQAAGSGT